MTRAEAAKKLCKRLVDEVLAAVPSDVFRWDEAWELVADADTSFVLTLFAWERTGSEDDRLKVRDAYRRLVAAWIAAAAEYERAGASRWPLKTRRARVGLGATPPEERRLVERIHDPKTSPWRLGDPE